MMSAFTTEVASDGAHALPARERMCEAARKIRDVYAMTPGAPFIKREFGFYCLDRWHREGLPQDANLAEWFDYERWGVHGLGQIGWCEAAFEPAFEVKVLEDRGEHELVQDWAGRQVLYFKGRRDGFMPEYLEHPVTDMRTWKENVEWRLDPATPARFEGLEARMRQALEMAGQGILISQGLIGGYMYLRSLIGQSRLPYVFYDHPELIHACMQAWLDLADAVIARHQEFMTLDEIFLAEDICYNHGPLISPDMMREFLLPYYQQLISNARRRQMDRGRHLYIQIDTDGDPRPVIPVYQEGIGMDVMSPFEVASGCDVVEIGRQYPTLVMSGGIDKRVLAEGKDEIDRFLKRVLPPMRERGGYTPTCDHGVPEEVSLENYLHYRRRCVEMGS